jgi:hypothetical protein
MDLHVTSPILSGEKLMANSSTNQLNAVRDTAGQLLESIIEQATAKAMNQTKKQSLTAQVRSKVPFQKKSNPSGRDLAMNAAAGALELWQAAVDRAGGSLETAQTSVSDRASSVQATVADSAQSLRETASSVGTSVGGTAQSLKGSVGDTAQAVKGSVGDTAQAVKGTVGGTAQAVTTSVSGAASSAKAGTRTAVATTASGGKNTVGLVFWTAAAGAVIYYAFLDEDLRAKVREIANTALVQAREMLADFQGQDGEFQPPA